ncbi:hypothetical protein PENSTE_c024G03401 [Penicillium steckii]|uniref:Yeast cell wall synthesis Kre9/Knh1-like N-terminal domain-containing protein n=1 Tax=Penicillium steckii TaxID=303698 RepID=A0A1V6SQX3_9EURO|nr:hypothetical protein PENSTE_c024G03401 [Penicillium steckii]
MQIILTTLAICVAFTSAALIADPELGQDSNGNPLPLNLDNDPMIKWSDTDPSKSKVYLYLSNFVQFPPECVSIIKGIDISPGQYTIPPGAMNCSIRGGPGYKFRISYEDNQCCGGFEAENNNAFNVVSYTTSNPASCSSWRCA